MNISEEVMAKAIAAALAVLAESGGDEDPDDAFDDDFDEIDLDDSPNRKGFKWAKHPDIGYLLGTWLANGYERREWPLLCAVALELQGFSADHTHPTSPDYAASTGITESLCGHPVGQATGMYVHRFHLTCKHRRRAVVKHRAEAAA